MGAMKGDDARRHAEGGVERGDVGVPDQCLGTPAHRADVEPVEQTHRAVAATHTPDTVDRVVGEGGVEIVQAMRVAAGEIACATGRMFADDGLPAEGACLFLGDVETRRGTYRTRRSDEGDARAWCERWRESHRGQRRERSVAVQPGTPLTPDPSHNDAARHLSRVTTLHALALAAPWVILPVVTIVRARHSRSLDEESADAPAGAPLVSLVIPARNEGRNIERCVRSALAASYPRLEVIAVDDHSTDDTGAILRRLAAEDARLRVVVPRPLPPGWFGKQWACTAGAEASSGDIIGFFDADTVQSPDLIARAVNAMRTRHADLLTVAGTQELGSFWERMIQPQIFAIMLTRYGGTESVNASRRASAKIANGQCIFVRRHAYEDTGGHGAVRDKVAEDLAMAQLYFRAGRRALLVLGMTQLSTRMYTSLHELVAGWGKNIFAGGRDAAPFGAVGRLVYPVLLVAPALGGVVPPLLLASALGGVLGHGMLVWSAIVTGANLIWWVIVYVLLGLSPVYALLYPLGSAIMLYIAVRSIARGNRVRWKDREYIAG